MQNKLENFENTISEIERNLRIGQRLQAIEKIDQILNSSVKITRNFYPKWCELLRRSGFSTISISILYRYVRSKGTNFKPATTQEKEEYAAALLSLKASEEAFLLLNELRKEKSPKTFLFLGMAHINTWDYDNAVKDLTTFLDFKHIPLYDRYIGIVNFMASKVAIATNNIREVNLLEEELDHHIEETARLNFNVLNANLLEIKSQLLVKSFNKASSQKNISRMLSIVNDPNSKENLFINKWAILGRKPKPFESRDSIKKWVKEIEELRKKAISINHIETIRDIDFHIGEFDSDSIEKVFFGTPYPPFKKKIVETYSLELPASYWFELPDSSGKKFEFDYLYYPDLRAGSVILNVLKSLTADFYKRQNKYTLFEFIFPDDYFNPHSSFNKIHQAIKRTRDWLIANKIPMEIKQENEEYFLVGNVAIKIYLNDRELGTEQKKDEAFYHEINLLRNHFQVEMFSLSEAMKFLKHDNPRKTQRLLKKGIEFELVARLHGGKNTIYSISPY